ncbi:MAG TPA: SpoIIE family protein phosphatase [Verrucomicrobiae bacterium]
MSKNTFKLLLIGLDSACETWLRTGEFGVERTDSLAAGLEKIDIHSFDLILVELNLPDSQGLNTFSQVRVAQPHTPVIVVADLADEELAARTILPGSQDYLLKPQLTGPLLVNTVRKTIDRHRSQLARNHEGFLLQTLMDHIPDAVYFKDTRSRFLMISRSKSIQHHLADPREAMGKTDHDFFTRPHADQALADEQRILRTGIPMVNIEESETWPDGSTTWASTTKMPLRNEDGRIVGTFGISRDITQRKLAELALAERTRQLHKKNEQIEDELKMARELQLAMLPQNFPSISSGSPAAESLKFFSFYIPSGAVSGDFFDVVPLSKTSVGIFICDVMGHDVRAALVTAMLRALVEDLSAKAADPGQLLAEINQILSKVFQQSGATMFATAFYLVADVATGQLSYASAAHPNPLHLKRQDGRVETLGPDAGSKKGPALGLFRDSKFPTCHRPMNEGDVIVLYTDGLIEQEGQNDEIFSQERLAETIQSLGAMPTKALLTKTLETIRSFSGQQEFSDDVCLLGIEVSQMFPPAR